MQKKKIKAKENKVSLQVNIASKSITLRFYSFTFSKAATRRFYPRKVIARRFLPFVPTKCLDGIKSSRRKGAERERRDFRRHETSRVTFHPEDGELDGYIGRDSAVEE